MIPIRNGANEIERCLSALRGGVSSEIIVVDDGSEDRSAEVAAGCGAKVIRQERKGAAAARNRGSQEARGDIVLFTDADCVPENGWLEKLSAPILENSADGVVGRVESNQKNWVARLIQMEYDERYSKMARQTQIDFLNTGNCGFRKDVAIANGFDMKYRWLEDVELSFRLAQKGYRLVFVPDAVVRHPHPESLWDYMVRKFRYARFAPTIYRRYPAKAISDSRTPFNRRVQLVLLAATLLLALGSPFDSRFAVATLACLTGSVAFSFPLIVRAFRQSVGLGFVVPFFVLLGNIAFVAGAIWGGLSTAEGR